MPDEVFERDGVVFVQSTGEYTLEVFKDSLRRSLALAKEKGLDKILVDARGQTALPGAMDTFEGAQELAARTAGMRIAVIMTSDLLADHSFFETAAVNRGAQIRTFLDEGDARRWLVA